MPDGLPGGDESSFRTMLRAARSAMHRAGSRPRDLLLADTVLCNAILHRLERIQDHARCVSELTRSRYSQFSWSKLDTMHERTRRVVDEGGVTALDEGILWEIVQELPALVAGLDEILG